MTVTDPDGENIEVYDAERGIHDYVQAAIDHEPGFEITSPM